ncbi:spore germination protein KC [Paenibacillus taihuensis]|uniref:Spore germination protein KC n=1 Tax=Paenibacillus taihuensis TaxID=1156355 RepID=A0A3D9QUJ8_9BACL|nr:Ger(x)C family spore germination protein [Paenibacillus taihuensis]REE67669.1 spore germination protein KC [Paenibacillus taihuensis]
MANRWRKPVKLAVVILMVFPFLAGCWDRLEIEDRAVVLGVSIDEAKKVTEEQEESEVIPNGPKTDMVHVAVQIALPGRIPLGPSDSGGGGGAGSQETLWVIDVIGHSIDDALMNLQQQISGRLFFGHLRVIVVSEKIARRGLENVNDFFRRNSEVRRMAWLLISKGNARKLMTAAPKLERVPTLYLMATLDEGIKMGKFPKDYIGIFWSNAVKKGQEGFLPYVELRKEDNVEISGLAIFKDKKMVGRTKALDIGAYMAIKGSNPAGYRVFVDLGGPKKNVMTSTTHRDEKTRISFKNGYPHFDVYMTIEINLEEKISDSVMISTTGTLKQVEETEKKMALKIYRDTIEMTQAQGADIFGFGELIRAKRPSYWNRKIRTKANWQEMYKEKATFDFHLTVKARRIGMRAK